MPYVDEETRRKLEQYPEPETPGELAYTLTTELARYVERRGLSFEVLAGAMGAMESTREEFYRCVVGPYEVLKMQANGDVFSERFTD